MPTEWTKRTIAEELQRIARDDELSLRGLDWTDETSGKATTTSPGPIGVTRTDTFCIVDGALLFRGRRVEQ